MATKNLLDYIKEDKSIRIVSWIGRITVLFIFISGIYLFNYYLEIQITKTYLMTNAIGFVLYLIISKARILQKYLSNIEPIILDDIKTYLLKKNIPFSSLRKEERYVKYIAFIPTIVFFLIYFISFLNPNIFLQEVFVLSIILQIFLLGFIKLNSFRDYMNELIRIYLFIVKSTDKEVDESELMRYNFRRLVIDAVVLGSVFFIILRYLLLPDLNILHTFLFVLSFFVLFMLGKGLYDAYKGFYKSLSQIDELRSKIGILKLNKDQT